MVFIGPYVGVYEIGSGICMRTAPSLIDSSGVSIISFWAHDKAAQIERYPQSPVPSWLTLFHPWSSNHSKSFLEIVTLGVSAGPPAGVTCFSGLARLRASSWVSGSGWVGATPAPVTFALVWSSLSMFFEEVHGPGFGGLTASESGVRCDQATLDTRTFHSLCPAST